MILPETEDRNLFTGGGTIAKRHSLRERFPPVRNEDFGTVYDLIEYLSGLYSQFFG